MTYILWQERSSFRTCNNPALQDIHDQSKPESHFQSAKGLMVYVVDGNAPGF